MFFKLIHELITFSNEAIFTFAELRILPVIILQMIVPGGRIIEIDGSTGIKVNVR